MANEKQFEVVARFDSEVEIDYYRHGGIPANGSS